MLRWAFGLCIGPFASYGYDALLGAELLLRIGEQVAVLKVDETLFCLSEVFLPIDQV
jgi:hypothetical protein